METGRAGLQRFAGKVALVTGGGSGIGQATAARLVAEGGRVAAADVRHTGSGVHPTGTSPFPVQLDVTDPRSVEAAMTEAVSRFGRLDVLVNAAGVLGFGAAHELEEDDWDRCMDVNLKGVYLTCRSAWPHLTAAGSASIVNLGSVLGFRALPADVPYCVSKAGLHMLTKCLALDGAPDGIRVNTVSPGYVDTPMTQQAFRREARPDQAQAAAVDEHPLGRLGEAEDLAGAIAYAASDDARWVTGSNLVVDGGYLLGGGHAAP